MASNRKRITRWNHRVIRIGRVVGLVGGGISFGEVINARLSGHRPARVLRLATAFTALAFYAVWVRPQMLTWGATPDETIGTYPGDELVPRSRRRGDDGHVPSGTAGEGLALAGADGRRPRRLVQLGLAGQQRRTESRSRRARVAEP